ncbi:BolA family protein [Sneathiella chinensis]|uniref:BolA family transcriptional regulator n=1 Tax=Sneathiella chinensis TaxID=349750 RepID=A0ABQ5U2Q2_9PROT|nr:BolA family protein [Sneathiella chinensis]GLQ05622.1 BolA family transcriptional regulator [Sneathiella chinensis]
MTVAERVEQKLKDAFSPATLDVIDESHLHAGHAGARPQGESHFRVHIVADAFEGKSRVERQRMIYQVLDAEMKTDIHALALVVKATSEGV